jgi:uncharacterized protein (TIGR03435 family)
MKYLALFFALTAFAPAQIPPPPERKAEFEVASVKAAKDDGDHDWDTDKGLLRIHNFSMKRLIAQAWQVDESLVVAAPNWSDSESYDITARIPAEFVDLKPSKVPEMMQALLADRFQLRFHRETRQTSGFTLVVAKRGPKMEPAKPDAEGSTTHGTRNHLTAQNISMQQLAARLSRMPEIGQIVVDRTGLAGRFNFELDWLPERPGYKPEANTDDLPTIFAAIQERLGLKLESAKVPIEAVVIDRAEKPESN